MKAKEIKDWTPYVGKRCLVTGDYLDSNPSITEVKVLEVSLSRMWVKFQYQSGYSDWELSGEYRFVEVLEG